MRGRVLPFVLVDDAALVRRLAADLDSRAPVCASSAEPRM